MFPLFSRTKPAMGMSVIGKPVCLTDVDCVCLCQSIEHLTSTGTFIYLSMNTNNASLTQSIKIYIVDCKPERDVCVQKGLTNRHAVFLWSDISNKT